MPLRVTAATIAIALASAQPAFAQETRVAPEGHVPPPAEIEEIAWLAGEWTGDGIGGAAAHEAWLAPTGDTMVGLFVQEEADGGIMFTEHMYIREVDGSLQVNLKHFNADLTGWEERDDMLTFRLVALEPCAAYFSALTYRCANGENTEDGMVVAVRMASDSEEIRELVFNFRRTEDIPPPAPCSTSETTLALIQCHTDRVNRAERQRTTYWEAALARREGDALMTSRLEAAEDQFESQRNAECSAIRASYGEGSFATPAFLICLVEITDERTHRIWRDWLSYGDSTPPDLPEPDPTL